MGYNDRGQKTRVPGCLFSFWITMTLFFLHPAFCNPYFGPFFQGHKPTHVFKTRIVGADWLGKWVDGYFVQKENPSARCFFCIIWGIKFPTHKFGIRLLNSELKNKVNLAFYGHKNTYLAVFVYLKWQLKFS